MGIRCAGMRSLDEDLPNAIRYLEGVEGRRRTTLQCVVWTGTCYFEDGQGSDGGVSLRRAVEVNVGSAVLLGCVGLAVERRKGEGAVGEALGWFERAVRVSEGRNALVRFRRAKILCEA